MVKLLLIFVAICATALLYSKRSAARVGYVVIADSNSLSYVCLTAELSKGSIKAADCMRVTCDDSPVELQDLVVMRKGIMAAAIDEDHAFALLCGGAK
jgi:hypothetical protein